MVLSNLKLFGKLAKKTVNAAVIMQASQLDQFQLRKGRPFRKAWSVGMGLQINKWMGFVFSALRRTCLESSTRTHLDVESDHFTHH